MEFIALQPPRTGALVYYPGDAQVKAGVYRVVDTDEYNMTEEIIIENSKGRAARSARTMDLLEISEEFLNIPVPEGADGVTFLPSEKALRDFGFSDHRPGYWYYCSRVNDRETLNITIPKEPIGDVKGESVYSYNELVMDEDFGQPAYFGGMVEPYRSTTARRVSAKLNELLLLGLQLQVDPREYAWKAWPEGKPLQGIHRDSVFISHLESGGELQISR